METVICIKYHIKQVIVVWTPELTHCAAPPVQEPALLARRLQGEIMIVREEFPEINTSSVRSAVCSTFN